MLDVLVRKVELKLKKVRFLVDYMVWFLEIFW